MEWEQLLLGQGQMTPSKLSHIGHMRFNRLSSQTDPDLSLRLQLDSLGTALCQATMFTASHLLWTLLSGFKWSTPCIFLAAPPSMPFRTDGSELLVCGMNA